MFSSQMIVGSNSACIETCGDGYNNGLQECDDGNKNSGDGCSSKCQIEDNYYCVGGFMGEADTCYHELTELKKAYLDDLNNIVLEYT